MARRTIAPPDSAVQTLAGLLAAHAPRDGAFDLRPPGVGAIRWSKTNREMMRATQQPVFCIVAQGAKVVMLGKEVYEYHAGRMVVFSVDLPIAGQFTRASMAKPFLCLRLDLDPLKIAELALKVYPSGLTKEPVGRALYVGEATAEIIDAAIRLLELAAHPDDASLLGPLVVDEILIRLLRSPLGTRVAQIGHAESRLRRIAEAVSWLRVNFAHATSVEELADMVHMSVSSFHQHFKAVTSMSPLQYQKVQRLQEARRLMLAQTMDATTACRQVGYLSAPQFNREYARFFGKSPARDVARLRQEAFGSVARSS